MPNITNDELLSQVLSAINVQSEALTKMIHDEILAVNIKIENEISGRIDALFDGYKLCHEQQFDLERRVHKIETRLDMVV